MKAIRLLKAYGANNTGELCGFPDEKAQALIKAGIGVAEGSPAKAETAPEPQPKPERLDKMEHGEQKRPRRSRRATADANDS